MICGRADLPCMMVGLQTNPFDAEHTLAALATMNMLKQNEAVKMSNSIECYSIVG